MYFRSLKSLLLLVVTFLLFGAGNVSAQYGFDAPGGVGAGAAVGIAPVDASIDGGIIPIGGTSQVVVLFRNEGAQPVVTGKINLYPSSNASADVSLNQCAEGPLASGAECAIAISVKGLRTGAWRLEMLMLHSGRSRLVTATLSGSVEAGEDSSNSLTNDIEVLPNDVDFGSLSTSQSLVQSVVLRNVTSKNIKISDIGISASDRSGYSVESECDELKSGQACVAAIKWLPNQKGPATGVLVVNHSGPSGLVSVNLSGVYQPEDVVKAEIFPEAIPGKGLLVSSQDEVDFGSSVVSASTITVSLVNTGDTAMTLNEIKISGSDNGINIAGKGCAAGVVLEPISACPLTITWSPTRLGDLLDDVQILHNGVRGILILPVRGTADGVVSQDQKAIVLQDVPAPTRVIGSADPTVQEDKPRTSKPISSQNAAGALDGLKITSFSSSRAIVNGPGGSRLIFNGEPVMLGGVMWDVKIQKNGIEFSNGSNRILLLFDRSLSSLNRASLQTSARNVAVEN